MNPAIHENFRQLLIQELIPAVGCTEPIAIALAAAKAREVLGEEPEHAVIECSGNIIKNVKGVTVPNSGGLKGIEIAAALGIIGGDPDKALQVLSGITPEAIVRAKQFAAEKRIVVKLVPDEDNLYLNAILSKGEHSAEVEIKYDHTRFNHIKRDGMSLFQQETESILDDTVDKSNLNLRNILDFANTIVWEKDPALAAVLQRQMECNTAIAREGIEGHYGAEVGRTLLSSSDNPNSPRTRARAFTAAGSDARMGGCSFPVVINSGSGNQGMTVSIPVIEYAQVLGIPHEKLMRALVVSNLTAIHQKRFIGKLSAFCGVVSAAAGAGVGIGYLQDFSYDQISAIIINTLGTTGGMICDGAKASCASKIAMALDNATMAVTMSKNGHVFSEGDGLVGADVEATIENFGRMARQGMRATDIEILRIMTGC